jgi:hypothetical protein
MSSQYNYEQQYSVNQQPILVNQQNRNYYQSVNFYPNNNNYGMQQGNNNFIMQPQMPYYSQPYVNMNQQYFQSNYVMNPNIIPTNYQYQNNYHQQHSTASQYFRSNNNNNNGQIKSNENFNNSNLNHSNKNWYVQKSNKKIRNLAINEKDNVESFSFQLYNLKEKFTKKMLQDLLNPYVNSIDFKPISTNQKVQEELNVVCLDEENVNVFIKFKNVDKLKEAFKLFKLNDSETASTSTKETNEKQIESPFLLRQIKIY